MHGNSSSAFSRPRLLLALTVALAGFCSSAHAAGDAHHGAEVFAENCAECHSVKEGKNKKGPSLFAIVGRKAATLGDFNYSDALKQGGILWTADRIDAYVTDPRKAVPGGKMKFDGLASAAERADLLAYLATLR